MYLAISFLSIQLTSIHLPLKRKKKIITINLTAMMDYYYWLTHKETHAQMRNKLFKYSEVVKFNFMCLMI